MPTSVSLPRHARLAVSPGARAPTTEPRRHGTMTSRSVGNQLLTQLDANANNEPVRTAAVTLSKTDLISFQ